MYSVEWNNNITVTCRNNIVDVIKFASEELVEPLQTIKVNIFCERFIQHYMFYPNLFDNYNYNVDEDCEEMGC